MHNNYLATVSDDVLMTPQVFIELMKKFRHHRYVQYGFSKKHTLDIQEYRRKAGMAKNESSQPGNLYSMPVIWNTEITYIK
jgi:hypothetical protein